jgi:hypothetical protein
MNLYLTYEEATAINERINYSANAAGMFRAGTNNYCNPYLDETKGLWVVPILEGYEEFFTAFELSIANQNMEPSRKAVMQDRWFCRNIHEKLLAAFKDGSTLGRDTYRQMSEIFWYAKDAADNGNPTNLRIELLEIPNEATLGLPGWNGLRTALIADIDAYLAQ